MLLVSKVMNEMVGLRAEMVSLCWLSSIGSRGSMQGCQPLRCAGDLQSRRVLTFCVDRILSSKLWS